MEKKKYYSFTMEIKSNSFSILNKIKEFLESTDEKYSCEIKEETSYYPKLNLSDLPNNESFEIINQEKKLLKD